MAAGPDDMLPFHSHSCAQRLVTSLPPLCRWENGGCHGAGLAHSPMASKWQSRDLSPRSFHAVYPLGHLSDREWWKAQLWPQFPPL